MPTGPAIAKIKGMPLVRQRLRKHCKCKNCAVGLLPGQRAYAPMVQATISGITRGDRFCLPCVISRGTFLEGS